METDAVAGEESYAEEQFTDTQEQIADEQCADAGEQPANAEGTSDAAEPSKRKKHFSRNDSRKKPKLSTVSAMDKNAVMLLHERFPGAIYSMVTQGGPVHQPLFTIEVKINDQVCMTDIFRYVQYILQLALFTGFPTCSINPIFLKFVRFCPIFIISKNCTFLSYIYISYISYR